ncbi:hypothetical protein ACLB2K_059164 [Fragaria x ananassa]
MAKRASPPPETSFDLQIMLVEHGEEVVVWIGATLRAVLHVDKLRLREAERVGARLKPDVVYIERTNFKMPSVGHNLLGGEQERLRIIGAVSGAKSCPIFIIPDMSTPDLSTSSIPSSERPRASGSPACGGSNAN